MMELLERLMMAVIIICAVWVLATWFALAYHNHKHRNE